MSKDDKGNAKPTGPRSTGDAAAKKAAATDAKVVSETVKQAGAAAKSSATPPKPASDAPKPKATAPSAPTAQNQTPKTGGATKPASAAADSAKPAASAAKPETKAQTPKSSAPTRPATAADDAAVALGPLLYGVAGAVIGGLIVLLFSQGDDSAALVSAAEKRIAALEAKIDNAGAAPAGTGVDPKTVEALGVEMKRVSTSIDKVETDLSTLQTSLASGKTGDASAQITALTTELAKLEGEINALKNAPKPASFDPKVLIALEKAAKEREAKLLAAAKAEDERRSAETAPMIQQQKTQLQKLTLDQQALVAAIKDQKLKLQELEAALNTQAKAIKSDVTRDFAAIDRALSAGDGFSAALTEIETKTDQPAPTMLKEMASSGGTSPAELAARFEQVSRDAQFAVARGAAEDGGLFDRLSARMIVEKAGDATGDDAAAVLARARRAAARGDVAKIVSIVGGMKEPDLAYALRSTAFSAWMKEARAALGASDALKTYRAAIGGE